jgi:hypothetical protein
VTVIHPHHPLRGQRVAVVRVRRGSVPSLVVRAPDGLHVALAVDWTDYHALGAAASSLPAPQLLAVDGLRQLALLIAQCRAEEQGAPRPRHGL